MSDTIPSKQIAEQAIAGVAELVRELNELRQFRASVPWVAIDRTVRYGRGAYMPDTAVNTLAIMGDWCDAYMPKEAAE